MTKLNLGCGNDCRPDHVNVDRVWNNHVDRVFDLNLMYWSPWLDNSIDEILMSHVLEHLHYPRNAILEIARILKHGGIARIRVPYATCVESWGEHTHIHQFTEKTFDTLRMNTGLVIQCLKLRLNTSTFLGRLRYLIPCRRILRHFFLNMYDEVYCELIKW